MTVVEPGSFELYAEYPILTPANEGALAETYAMFRPGRSLNGYIEFNIDPVRFGMAPDREFPGISNAKVFQLLVKTLDGLPDMTYIDNGYSLRMPRVNPEFFDRFGNRINP
jgi:hypothetical protein